MKNKIIFAVLGTLLSASVYAGGMEDDPILTKVMIDQLEYRVAKGPDPVVLEAQAWIGKDLNKFVINADVEQVLGSIEEQEIQALYSRAVYPYWDFQIGVQNISKPGPNRNALAIGFQGLAPYFFEMDTTLFIGEKSQVGLRVSAEYEILFTQRLILSPEVEVNIFSKDDSAAGIGAGLSNSRAGLRLRYEIRREFAPYIGINWLNKYGNTANYARTAGEIVSDTQFVFGVRAWF